MVFHNIEKTYLHLYIFLSLSPLLYFIIFKKIISTLRFPPGPFPWPILGNIVDMVRGGDLPHVTLANFAKTYGPLVLIKLGTQYTLVASSPDVAIEILKTHDHKLYGRHVPKAIPGNQKELNKSSVVWSEASDDGWRSLRALLRTELFSVKAMNGGEQSRIRERKVIELMGYLKGKEGEVVNVGEVVFGTIFNILSNVFLSNDLIGLEEKVIDGGMKRVIRELMEIASAANLSDFYPFLSKFDPQSLHKKSKKLLENLHSMWLPIIQARKKQVVDALDHQQDFLEVLISKKVTDEDIDQLFFEMFMAGSDTSTATVEWAMAEIIKNPKCMKRIREELDREFNQDSVKETMNLMKLPYLQACIKETYRLHPPTPLLLPRRAPEGCILMNYTIPKDTRILVNVWAIGRDPLVWDDPLTFKPERFLDSSLDFKGNDFEFIPFGAGRRICPGIPMAGVVVSFVLASLIHAFDWSVHEEKEGQRLDMNEKFGLTLQKKLPLLLIPKPRK